MKRLLDRAIVGELEYWLFRSRRESWGGPFNGQSARQEWFCELIATYHPNVIVETGTYRGTTTRFMAAQASDARVHTVEWSPRAFGFARANLRGLRNVRLIRGDSREALRRIVAGLSPDSDRAFFYLDAHWGRDLPLAEELEVIFGRVRAAIAAIDDFQVPDDPGYGFDYYDAERALTFDGLAPTFGRLGLRTFVPSRPSAKENGQLRGMVVAALEGGSLEILSRMRTLRPYPPLVSGAAAE